MNFTVVEYNTKATASFKTDSPNTKEYKVESTFKTLKIAKMVTVSVADITAPKL